MADAGFLYEIRCATCQRSIGVSLVKKFGIYCDAFCAQDIAAVEEEGRDAVIEAILRDTDIPAAEIARRFGFSRQRIYQLKDSRDLRKQVQS